MKFTFKTDKPTGRYRSFFKSTHHIKLKKKRCGIITDEEPYRIKLQLMGNDENPNCNWRWATLKVKFESVQEAKDFLNKHIEAILKKYELHFSDD